MRTRVNDWLMGGTKGKPLTGDRPSISEAFTLGKNESETVLTCASPVCNVQFEQTGIMRMEPRRFCCDQCKLDAWAIRRVQKLVKGLPDATVIEILKAHR